MGRLINFYLISLLICSKQLQIMLPCSYRHHLRSFLFLTFLLLFIFLCFILIFCFLGGLLQLFLFFDVIFAVFINIFILSLYFLVEVVVIICKSCFIELWAKMLCDFFIFFTVPDSEFSLGTSSCKYPGNVFIIRKSKYFTLICILL